jgi:hypothetical protein
VYLFCSQAQYVELALESPTLNFRHGILPLVFPTNLATFKDSSKLFHNPFVFQSSIFEDFLQLVWYWVSKYPMHFLILFLDFSDFKLSSLSTSNLIDNAMARWLYFVLSSLNVSPVFLSLIVFFPQNPRLIPSNFDIFLQFTKLNRDFFVLLGFTNVVSKLESYLLFYYWKHLIC